MKLELENEEIGRIITALRIRRAQFIERYNFYKDIDNELSNEYLQNAAEIEQLIAKIRIQRICFT